MKKLLLIAFMLSVFWAFYACDDDEAPAPPPKDPVPTDVDDGDKTPKRIPAKKKYEYPPLPT